MLSCDCLDTLCDVFLNGEKIGEGKNAHLKYEFDIKDIAKGSSLKNALFRMKFAVKRENIANSVWYSTN